MDLPGRLPARQGHLSARTIHHYLTTQRNAA